MLLPLILAFSASQTTIVLTATDSKSVSSQSQEDFNDNVLRAAWDNPSQGYVDGLLKFDFSSIPNKSSISSMSLRLYHQAGTGSPFQDPKVVVYHQIVDSWARGQDDFDPLPNQFLTGQISSFPVGDLVAVDIPLNALAVNWTQDLTDDVASFQLRNVAGAAGHQSYVYFYGSDASPAPPELTLTYSSDPGISVQNLRNNVIAIFEVSNATTGKYSAVFLSRNGSGPTVMNAGPCSSITFGLSPRVYMLGKELADASGTAVITFPIPRGAAGVTVWIQGADFGTCKTSVVYTGVVM